MASESALGVSEREWAEGIGQSDVRAFEAMVHVYRSDLARLAAGLLRSREDAEDVLQDVLWRVWEARGEWRPAISIHAYLVSAVRNRSLNLLDRRLIRAQYQERAQQAAEHEPETWATPSPSEVFEAEEERVALTIALRRAFAELTERQQTAIRLHYEAGLTFPEVAVTLRVSLRAAEQIVARGIRAMRAGMQDGFAEVTRVA